jgi:hypothetical protein
MRQTCGREYWNFLATGDRVHNVDRRDTSLDHLLGVDTRIRVNRGTYDTINTLRSLGMEARRTIDIEVVLCKDLWTLINRVARAVEYPSQHVLCHRELHA